APLVLPLSFPTRRSSDLAQRRLDDRRRRRRRPDGPPLREPRLAAPPHQRLSRRRRSRDLPRRLRLQGGRLVAPLLEGAAPVVIQDRKSTRLNSSHSQTSY